MKTEAEALLYAVSWLRAFPALPTAAPHVREERAAVVERLEAMLREVERDDAWVRSVTRLDTPDAPACADEGAGCEVCEGRGEMPWIVGGVSLDPMRPERPHRPKCPACDGTGRGGEHA